MIRDHELKKIGLYERIPELSAFRERFMKNTNPCPVKLAFLVTEDHYFCSHRWDLAKDALERGYEVHVITNVTNSALKIQKGGFHLHKLSHMNRTKLSPLKDLLCLVEIYLTIKKIKPHILHNVAWKPTLYGTLAALFNGVPKIINMLGGLGYAFTAEGPKAHTSKKIISFIGRRILSKTRCQIIVQNEENQDTLIKMGLARSNQIHIIKGSGIDVDYYHPLPRTNHDPTEVISFICASRLIQEKGLRELAEAMKYIRNNPEILKGQKIRVILYGAIDEKYPNKISEDELRLWQNQGWIEWRGYESDIRGALHQCDAVIFPSYAEGLPKFLLEASACGKPIITTDVSGCRDIVRHNYNGILIPPFDSQAIVKAILEFIHNSKTMAKMGENGRFHVLQNFSKSIIHEQIFHLYDEQSE